MSASGPPCLTLDPAVAELVAVGQVYAYPVSVAPSSATLRREIEALREELRREQRGQLPSRTPDVAPARALYRAFGIDPTRRRPSSEALLRRTLDDKPWPEISNAVDLGNLCALRFMLPLGLYDAERVTGRVVLRRGLAGESYRGVRKDEVSVEGRPVLADERGAFGNPTADSSRTAVSASTRALWMVVFAPASYDRARLARHLVSAREAMECHLGSPGEPPRVSLSVLDPDA